MKTLNKIKNFEKLNTSLNNIEIEKILNSLDKFSRKILNSKNIIKVIDQNNNEVGSINPSKVIKVLFGG